MEIHKEQKFSVSALCKEFQNRMLCLRGSVVSFECRDSESLYSLRHDEKSVKLKTILHRRFPLKPLALLMSKEVKDKFIPLSNSSMLATLD